MKIIQFAIFILILTGIQSSLPEISTSITCNTALISTEKASQYRPITSIGLQNGGWVLAWVGADFGVYFDYYSNEGFKLKSAQGFITNLDPSYIVDKELRGCATSSGGFVISYRTPTYLKATFFDEKGDVLNADVQISSQTGANWHYTICNPDGKVWFAYPPSDNLKIRSADNSGNLNAELDGDTDITVEQIALGHLSGGTFYALLHRVSDKNLYMKTFDSTGTMLTNKQQINSASPVGYPCICTLGNGNKAMVYSSYGGGNYVAYFRIYSGTTPVTNEMTAGTSSFTNPDRTYCASLGPDKFVIVFIVSTSNYAKRIVVNNDGTVFNAEYSYPGSGLAQTYPYVHSMANGDVVVSFLDGQANGDFYRHSYRLDSSLNIVNPSFCFYGGYYCNPTDGTCSACSSGKFYSDNICKKSCASGFFADSTTGNCTACSSGCSACSSSSVCTSCKSSYILSNGACIAPPATTNYYVPAAQTSTGCNTPILSSAQGSAYRPIVSFGLVNGGWVLGWVGPSLDVYFDAFDKYGNKVISAKKANSALDNTDPAEKELRGCGTSSGGFVISYKTGLKSLKASFFDENGTAIVQDVVVSSETQIDWHHTLCLSTGMVMFSYSPNNVHLLRPADDFGNLGFEYTADSSHNYQMTFLAEKKDGGFYALSWEEDNSHNLYLKSFDMYGTASSSLIQVDESADSSLYPSICPLGDGNMAIVYCKYNPASKIFIRIYNDVNPVTNEILAWTEADTLYRLYCSALGSEKFVIVFSGDSEMRTKKLVFNNNGTLFSSTSDFPASLDKSYPYIHSIKNGDVIISYSYLASPGGSYTRQSWRYDSNLKLINPSACQSGGFDCDGGTGFCAGCLDGKFFSASTCVATCPPAHYSDVPTTMCYACPQGCSVCASNTSCSGCLSGYQVYNGLCYNSLNCPATCDTCLNTTYCHSCKASYYLGTDNTCKEACPSDEYTNTTSMMCMSCVGIDLKLIQGACVLLSTISLVPGGSIQCLSPSNCGKYFNQISYIFKLYHPEIVNYSAFDYYWDVSELTALQYAQAFDNNLYIINNNHTLIGTGVVINVLVYNLTNYMNLSVSIPLNTPPTGGQLVSSPTSGLALDTSFTLTTSIWVDGDSPLNYTFYYISFGIKIPIGPSGPSASISTTIPGNANNSQTIYCYATDIYGASSEVLNVTVQITSPTNPLDNIQLVDNLIAGLSPNTPEANLISLAVANSQLNAVNQLVPSVSDCSTSCSGHGTCDSFNLCVCNSTWSLDDCSLNATKLNDVVSKKNQIASLMRSNLDILSNLEYRTGIYAALNEGTTLPDFADSTFLGRVVDILENKLDILNPNTILTLEESNAVANILNNMLIIQGKRDCAMKDNFTIALENRTNSYLECFSRNTLRSTVPIQPPVKNLNFQFDLFTKTLGLCDINNYEIRTSADAPVVILKYSPPTIDCKQVVTIQYYVFRPNIFSCRKNETNLPFPAKDQTKTLIAIGVKQNGMPLNLTIRAVIKMPGTVLCPNDCQKDSGSGQCLCQTLDPFDIKGQISRIFSASKLSLIGNFDVLLSFKYYEHAFFWLLLAYAMWYLCTVYLVWTKYKGYNVVQNFTKKHNKSWERAIYTIFMGQYYFSVYLIILPYITFVPIMIIISLLLKNEPGKKLTTGTKIRLLIGAIITLAVIIACYLIVLILGAQSTSDERKAFIINFIITLIQDLIVNPAVGTSIMFVLYFIYTRGVKPLKKALNHPKVKKGLEDAIGKDGFEVARYLDDHHLKKKYEKKNDAIEQFHVSQPKKITRAFSKASTQKSNIINQGKVGIQDDQITKKNSEQLQKDLKQSSATEGQVFIGEIIDTERFFEGDEESYFEGVFEINENHDQNKQKEIVHNDEENRYCHNGNHFKVEVRNIDEDQGLKSPSNEKNDAQRAENAKKIEESKNIEQKQIEILEPEVVTFNQVDVGVETLTGLKI